mgnify:CR=1 FL=1|jgi:beta-N-acetylhexosaminidase
MAAGCSLPGKRDDGYPAEQEGNGTETPAGDPSEKDTDGEEQLPDGNEKNDGGVSTGDGKDTDIDETIRTRLSRMTLDEKIGQMFIIGLEGTYIDEDIKRLVADRLPGGFILFRHNITDADQLLTFINDLKTANDGNIPLFISVDEEGGRISRLPDQLRAMPSAMSVSELDNETATYETGKILAERIRIFGFNMDFAPVLDILSNPDNTVIGDRAFGTNAQSVSKHGIQMMKGIRDTGIIPVVKHFPGHGDTDIDSHLGLPIISQGMDLLSERELVPFRRAVDEGAEAVMAAHIVVTAVDPRLPASLSGAVINGLLRKDSGFDGVVITDDLTMRAITDNFEIGDAAVRSVIAGCDILLVCHGRDKQEEAMDAVRNAVEAGMIDECRIDESVARILKLKEKYGLNNNAYRYADVDMLNEKIDGLLAKWYNDN